MTTVFEKFDSAKTAFINPTDFIREEPGFPEVCITTFSEAIVQNMARMEGVREIARLISANGTLPVYEMEYEGKKIGFFLSRVGAPACVVGLEEVHAMGAKKIVVFGSCGVLDQAAVDGEIVIPVSAVRDEGTSYHYLPASQEVTADAESIRLLKRCLEDLQLPYVEGKTWTTDGIYRETVNAIEERRQQGCLTVEMECAAIYAMAKFRRLPVLVFLYGADNLDSEQWEMRDLMDYGSSGSGRYVRAALACANAFLEQPVHGKY